MLEKLDFMVRFWNLKARHGDVASPLSRLEQVELLSLMRLMATDHPLPEAGPPPRSQLAIPVQLTAPGGFVKGQLRLVCGGGLVVACEEPLRAGKSTLIRIADTLDEIEYTLPCVVAWSYTGSPGAMGLRVDGVPTRLDVATPSLPVWRSPLHLGRTATHDAIA